MSKKRLDLLLYERGLVKSREQGRRLILAGEVSVDGLIVDKVATPTDEEAHIEIAEPPPFASRAGFKLAEALNAFRIEPTGWIAADVGASTGGFTDCLLQHGVRRVYAIDVGYGQMRWELRQDPRVIVMDRTNARYLERLPEAVDLVTIDVSFISLRLILPQVAGWLRPDGQVIALVKPQFEAGHEQVGKGGIVRNGRTHRDVLSGVLAWAEGQAWKVHGLIRSPITGAKGNVEFLIWLSQAASLPSIDWNVAIREVLEA